MVVVRRGITNSRRHGAELRQATKINDGLGPRCKDIASWIRSSVREREAASHPHGAEIEVREQREGRHALRLRSGAEYDVEDLYAAMNR